MKKLFTEIQSINSEKKHKEYTKAITAIQYEDINKKKKLKTI